MGISTKRVSCPVRAAGIERASTSSRAPTRQICYSATFSRLHCNIFIFSSHPPPLPAGDWEGPADLISPRQSSKRHRHHGRPARRGSRETRPRWAAARCCCCCWRRARQYGRQTGPCLRRGSRRRRPGVRAPPATGKSTPPRVRPRLDKHCAYSRRVALARHLATPPRAAVYVVAERRAGRRRRRDRVRRRIRGQAGIFLFISLVTRGAPAPPRGHLAPPFPNEGTRLISISAARGKSRVASPSTGRQQGQRAAGPRSSPAAVNTHEPVVA